MCHGVFGPSCGGTPSCRPPKKIFDMAQSSAHIRLMSNTNVKIISDTELAEKLDKSPAERVTAEYMQSRISKTEFTRLADSTVTHCRLTVDNGFGVSGESACVNPENYNQEIGEKIAYDNAFRQLWAFFGFLLAEKNKMRSDIKAA